MTISKIFQSIKVNQKIWKKYSSIDPDFTLRYLLNYRKKNPKYFFKKRHSSLFLSNITIIASYISISNIPFITRMVHPNILLYYVYQKKGTKNNKSQCSKGRARVQYALYTVERALAQRIYLFVQSSLWPFVFVATLVYIYICVYVYPIHFLLHDDQHSNLIFLFLSDVVCVAE